MNDGKRKRGQKHQNKTAYKIQFDPLSQQIHKKVSFRGLCKRCTEQLEWRIQYNKYKKMTEPAKCNFCHCKNVLRTYMRACEACSESLKTCPKCLTPDSEQQVSTRLNQREQKSKQAEDQRKMNQFLKTLKERSRRTVKRLFEKNQIRWSPQENNFIDEEGNFLSLHFRQGYDDKEQGYEAQGSDESSEEASEQQADRNIAESESSSKQVKEERYTRGEGTQKTKQSNQLKEGQLDNNGQENEQQWEDIDSTEDI